MKKYGYGWLLKFVLAAILLGVGIYLIFEKSIFNYRVAPLYFHCLGCS